MLDLYEKVQLALDECRKKQQDLLFSAKNMDKSGSYFQAVKYEAEAAGMDIVIRTIEAVLK